MARNSETKGIKLRWTQLFLKSVIEIGCFVIPNGYFATITVNLYHQLMHEISTTKMINASLLIFYRVESA